MVRIKSNFYMSHLERLVDTYRAVTTSMNKEVEEASKRLDTIRSDIEKLIIEVENYLRKDNTTSALELVNAYAKKYLQKSQTEKEKNGTREEISDEVRKYIALRSRHLEYDPSEIAKHFGVGRLRVYRILESIPHLKPKKTTKGTIFYNTKPAAEEKPKSYGNLSENVKRYVAMRQNQREFMPRQIAADLNTRAVSAVYNILSTIPYLKQRKKLISSSELTIFDNTRPKKSKKKR